MTRSSPSEHALEALLNAARLNDAEVEQRLTDALDRSYWQSLVPFLPVCDINARSPEAALVSTRAIEDATRGVTRDGVFALRGAIPPQRIERLNDALHLVTSAGWPAAFVFVYDAFWEIPRLEPIVRVVTRTLGDGCAQIQPVWVHIVRPSAGASGWAPHVDGHGRGRLSLWVALTDATPDNGCIYTLARGATPGRFMERQSDFTRAELTAALHGARALTATAGDVLGWMFDIVHWGGQAQPGAAERRALSFEFIAATERGGEDQPVFSLEELPAFEARLCAIATGIKGYRRFEPLLIRFEEVATRLLAQLSP